MANEKVSQLPTVASAQSTDIIYAIQGGVSVQETLGQVLTLGLGFDTLFYAGNPNGNLGGQTYQRCWDTTNNTLWICTTTGSSTTAVWQTAYGTLTDGQLIVGFTGNAPQRTQLTAGTNISISNGPGSITIAASGTLTFNWVVVTTTTQSMAANAGYIANNASQVQLTLPVNAAVGDILGVIGQGAGGWIIKQNAGQKIQIGQVASTIGVTGSVASSENFNSVRLICTVANTTWETWGGPQGSLVVS